jgi:hypothetical protein
MPKARRRKRVIGRGASQSGGQGTTSRVVSTGQSAAVSQNGHSDPARAANAASVNRLAQAPVVRGPQSLIFPAMVALGCWGMAFTFLFLSTDPNRTIYGVMAVLMALLWSFSLGVRVRKLVQQRSQ